MHTPYFPPWRSRLAALGRRTAQAVRQTTLAQLQHHLRDLLPAPLLASEDEGDNSRDRIFNLRLTFECFVWQLLQPRTACREVVRQVQALFRLHDLGPVADGDSGYIQARQRLPRERFEHQWGQTACLHMWLVSRGISWYGLVRPATHLGPPFNAELL